MMFLLTSRFTYIHFNDNTSIFTALSRVPNKNSSKHGCTSFFVPLCVPRKVLGYKNRFRIYIPRLVSFPQK